MRTFYFLLVFFFSFTQSYALSETIALPEKRPDTKLKNNSLSEWQTKEEIPLPTRNPNATKLGDKELTEWEEDKITSAQNECKRILANIQIQYEPIPPFRKGRCGTPAPIKLQAIGAKKLVTLSPPPKINCRIAAALNKWVEEKLQPLAKEMLNTSIVKIRNMSSYSCRTRYGNPFKRISEHAYANALDIAGFTTSEGDYISVLKHWGPTERDINADQKKQKQRALKALQVKDFATNIKYKNQASDKSKVTDAVTFVPLPVNRSTYLKKNHYGDFLREIHEGACGIFGTVLGPESNEAHRNHFHFDLAKRRSKAFCE